MTQQEWVDEQERAIEVLRLGSIFCYQHGDIDAGTECYRRLKAIRQQIREALEVEP